MSPTNWIGVLISCAMPAASWPTASSFCARRSSSSMRSRSASRALGRRDVEQDALQHAARRRGRRSRSSRRAARSTRRRGVDSGTRPSPRRRVDGGARVGEHDQIVGVDAAADERAMSIGQRVDRDAHHVLDARADVQDRRGAVVGGHDVVRRSPGAARSAPDSGAATRPAAGRVPRRRPRDRSRAGARRAPAGPVESARARPSPRWRAGSTRPPRSGRRVRPVGEGEQERAEGGRSAEHESRSTSAAGHP